MTSKRQQTGMRRVADDKALTGLAGEFYVLAQLAQRGLVGALTLGHTKGVDIVVTNPRTGTMRRVEVKTRRENLGRHALFGPGRFYDWQLSGKHERITDSDLLYCFVSLGSDPTHRPKFFLVPARDVARYVRWEHRHWMRARPGRKENDLRQMRIEEADPHGYAENWGVFD